ncbi:hypothetical protein PUR28_20910 [Streptomyces sp. BE308]|uniref:hypothetical protein n=1 Tax=Streptomyces sp. BE308 TaxID=3002529 RepID=UPI002E76E9DA|nr:hypothetical protein [Streptomyces sp. BE308]MEE1793187.1 hypothetical protein [Streptomyces sp. BE308]
MGWTVLYIAFGFVALWLLGEVLLQYKARLRWRLLAFGGFLTVVMGVLIASVPVIVVGAIAFATGQTYVTLSFRRGFSTGWAIGGSPGESRRRRGGGERAATKEPTLQVSDLEYEQPLGETAAVPAASVYEPQPLPDDTGQYGVYNDNAYPGNGRQDDGNDPGPGSGHPERHEAEPQPQYGAYPPYGDYDRPAAAQDTYAGQYDYGTGQQQSYAAYSDPYIGTGPAGGAAPYASYDGYGNGYDSFGGQQQYADPYPQQYDNPDTPPGGVWVPQQRDAEQFPPMPPEQPVRPAPYGNGNDTGQNEPYRY